MPWMRPATDTPFGAIPYDVVLRITAYNKDANASRIFPGDFVILELDGNINVATTTSTAIVGVAVHGSPVSTADSDFLVYDHPEQLFTIQDDSAASFANQTAIGNNFDITATTGDTTLDRSAHELDISSGTTAAGPLRLIGLHPMETGVATATNQQRKLVVKINAHILDSETGV